jgi:hypothetical protein
MKTNQGNTISKESAFLIYVLYTSGKLSTFVEYSLLEYDAMFTDVSEEFTASSSSR